MPPDLHVAMQHDLVASAHGHIHGHARASNKTIAASSVEIRQNNPLSPEFLIDGELSTRWSSEFKDEQWVAIQLVDDSTSEACNVTQVRLHWEEAYALNYEIQVREHGKREWLTVVHDQRRRAKIGSQLLHVHDLAAKADTSRITEVKLVCHKRATQWGFSLYEIEVLGKCGLAAADNVAEDPVGAANAVAAAAADAPAT
jgi:GNAT superfamily N-acetyltransferase